MRRACHCTLYAEAMSSRAAATAGTWVRQMLLEILFSGYRATMSVEDKVPAKVEGFLKLHIVTDCNSLHETVVKSSLPEDKRAALEVLAIREMVVNEEHFSDDEVEEETERLKERDISGVYHWCVSEDQKADILTKNSNTEERASWHDDLNWISLRSVKKTDLQTQKAVPSQKRPKLDKEVAKKVLDAQWTAARAAGFSV